MCTNYRHYRQTEKKLRNCQTSHIKLHFNSLIYIKVADLDDGVLVTRTDSIEDRDIVDDFL